MNAAAADAPVVTDNPGASRYELRAGDRLAGFVDYRLNEKTKVISLIHTQVEPAFEGQHLGSQLARYSLDDARRRGLGVLPFCPYIQAWIGKHPEYADLIPPGRAGEFDLRTEA